MRTILNNKVLHIFVISLLSLLFFVTLNITFNNYHENNIVNNFKEKTSLIKDTDITVDDLYTKHDIIKLIYQDEKLLVSPSSYNITFYFETNDFDDSKINNYLGYFVFEKIVVDDLEIIYFQRLSQSDVNNNFVFLSVLLTSLSFIISIGVYIIMSKKIIVIESRLKSIYPTCSDIYGYIKHVEDNFVYSRLFKDFIDYSNEGLIVFDKDKIIFNNKVSSDFIINFELKDMYLIECIKKTQLGNFVKEEYEINDVIYLITTRSVLVQNIEYYTMHIENITERVNFKKNQINFFNQASHELRTPLTNLILLVQLLFEEDDEALLEKMRVDSINECRKLDVLITSIIDLSKRFDIDDTYEKVNLENLLYDVLESHKYSSLKLSVTVSKKHSLICNKSKVKIIMENIIKNAFVHNITSGFVDIEIKEHLGLIEFIVKNSSDSIKTDDITRVFDAFFKCTTNDSRGAGLGLTVTKMITDKYDYDLKFEHKDGNVITTVKFFMNNLNKHLKQIDY